MVSTTVYCLRFFLLQGKIKMEFDFKECKGTLIKLIEFNEFYELTRPFNVSLNYNIGILTLYVTVPCYCRYPDKMQVQMTIVYLSTMYCIYNPSFSLERPRLAGICFSKRASME